MKFKSIASAVLSFGLIAGSVILVVPPVQAGVNLDVIIGVPPPEPRVERVPEAREGFAWIPGFWRWEGNRHIWSDGHWEPERRGYEYQPAHWDKEGDRWHFREGVWIAKERHGEHREARGDHREHDR